MQLHQIHLVSIHVLIFVRFFLTEICLSHNQERSNVTSIVKRMSHDIEVIDI